MYSTLSAIILNTQKYSDKAVIIHTYTKEYGRLNFMVYNSKKNTQQRLPAPLSLVEITADIRTDRSLNTLRNWHYTSHPLHQDDIRRSCVSMFVAEVIVRNIRHTMADADLYQLLEQTVYDVDYADSVENIHILFLQRLADILGFGIDAYAHPDLLQIPTTRQQRQEQLKMLCAYLEKHIEDFTIPKSLPILMELFD